MTKPTDDAHAAIRASQAEEPHPANHEKLRLFGQFVGTWNMDIHF